jgi:putative nucleotidyltransferase with HDIG domain
LKHWRIAARQAARQAAAREAQHRGCTALDYRWEHVQAVVATALRLAQQVGADQQVVEAAAWLHDIAKDIRDGDQREHHGQAGAKLARAVLADSDFDADKIEAVAEAIVKHVGLVSERLVEPLEAAVLWDADKLTKLGNIGALHATVLGVQTGRVNSTPDVSEWVYPPDLWARIAASMNTAPARQAAQARLLAFGAFARRLNQEWSAADLSDPCRTSGYTAGAMSQDGRDGVLWSPLWRLRVELTAPERALLQTWPLRRLHFLHHNGAGALVYPLPVSRLQHTLGVLALAAHFAPDDVALRAAALLHDVGHYPFCHSAELVPGVDHHAATRRRVSGEPLGGILRAHDLDPEHLLDLMDGRPPNPLRTRNGLLHLDHLDSWAREAQAAGFAEMPAHELLDCLSLEGNNVAAADRASAEYLVRLIRQGNERHYAQGSIGPGIVLARVLTLSLERDLITPTELADATDEALLARLVMSGDDEVVGLVALLRREPWRIVTRKDPELSFVESSAPLMVSLDALYDAVPLLAGTGQPITQVSALARAEMARLKELVGTFAVYF